MLQATEIAGSPRYVAPAKSIFVVYNNSVIIVASHLKEQKKKITTETTSEANE